MYILWILFFPPHLQSLHHLHKENPKTICFSVLIALVILYLIPCLDLDIQVEIMKRLPVKSLIQFRSVCKTWKSMIDSSRFISDHNNVRNDRSDEHLMIRCRAGDEKFVCFVDDDSDSFLQNKFTPDIPPIFRLFWPFNYTTIHTSCGLLCLEGLLREPDDSETHTVLLWNPSVRKSVAIVVPNDDDAHSHFFFATPSRVFPFVGFGVCPETKDPKLVKISRNDDENRVMVFTLSSREWRCLSSGNQLPHKSLEFKSNSQTVIGRLLYCLAFDGEFYRIWSFDLSTDEFREVPLPDSLRRSYLGMSKVRESFVLIDEEKGYSSTEDSDVFDVWMMMEDGGAFTKLFTIKKASVERILGFKKTNASIERIMGFRKTGEPVVKIEIESPDDDGNSALIAVYDPRMDHIKDLGICRPPTFFAMCSYNESLLLLDHDDDGCIVRAPLLLH